MALHYTHTLEPVTVPYPERHETAHVVLLKKNPAAQSVHSVSALPKHKLHLLSQSVHTFGFAYSKVPLGQEGRQEEPLRYAFSVPLRVHSEQLVADMSQRKHLGSHAVQLLPSIK